MIEFLRTTILGGVLFLVPLIVVLLIIRQALDLLAKVFLPIERHLLAEVVAGVTLKHILAAAVLILLCFLAGLVARTRHAARFSEQAERLILKRMPGFTLLKGVIGGQQGLPADHAASVALARLDEAWLLCFILERHANGLLTVFVPSAPTPSAGSIYYLTEDQVRRLDVPVGTAMACVMQLGIGSKDMLARQLAGIETAAPAASSSGVEPVGSKTSP